MASIADKEPNTSNRVIHRLVRTLSGRRSSVPGDPAPPVMSPPVVVEEAATYPPTVISPVHTPHASKQKPGVLERFKGIRKFGRSRSSGSSGTEPVGVVLTTDPLSSTTPPTDSDTVLTPESPPEPNFLARRIRALVDALPPLPSPNSSRTLPSPKSPKAPGHDADGRPIPPPDATQIKDSRLVAILSSATVMNGSSGNGRPSIWSVLDRLGAPKHKGPADESSGGGSGERDGNADAEHDDELDTDDSSVMMYSPLMPTRDSIVELAESEMIPLYEDAEGTQDEAQQPGWWPFPGWRGKEDGTETDKGKGKEEQPPIGDTPAPPEDGGGSNKPKKVKVPVHRVWVPSATKLSLQAMWWGYRLYLPPPVLAILSDKQLEASKRAALITNALTWFFSHLPVSSFPPPMQPVILLLQRLVPYVGYIGTFISWSWGVVKGYDKGFGVILTATWILPVALIPGTWGEHDFPTTPTSPTSPSAPLPPIDPPAPSNPSHSQSAPPAEPVLADLTPPEVPAPTKPNGTPGDVLGPSPEGVAEGSVGETKGKGKGRSFFPWKIGGVLGSSSS